MNENPLAILIQQLMEQAGPRGATFAGRHLPQGSQPDLRTLMTQIPTEVGEDGWGALATGTGIAGMKLLPPPKKLMNISPKGPGYAGERFPHSLDVNVQFPGMDPFDDAIKGLNPGHAAARARSNWPGASIAFPNPIQRKSR